MTRMTTLVTADSRRDITDVYMGQGPLALVAYKEWNKSCRKRHSSEGIGKGLRWHILSSKDAKG